MNLALLVLRILVLISPIHTGERAEDMFLSIPYFSVPESGVYADDLPVTHDLLAANALVLDITEDFSLDRKNEILSKNPEVNALSSGNFNAFRITSGTHVANPPAHLFLKNCVFRI
ncbi:MAG: hypothetical protein GC181_12850 [Bacteroidetes bacterium]|nr:hypothetical protein [Bacteroidota bacterium]